MKGKIYNQSGEEAGSVDLPERVFNAPWRPDLVRQVVLAMQANARTPVAHTKDRGAVSGGGRKPWRQKGTGRARHGSIRSPLWRGGGTTFGPLNARSYTQKINRKMRIGALFSVLSRKFRDGEVVFVDKLSLSGPKSKEAKLILERLSKIEGYTGIARRRHAALITLGKRDESVEKSFRNFGNVRLDEARRLNPELLLRYKYIVITDPETSIASFEDKLA